MGPRPLWPKEIDGLHVPSGKAYTQMSELTDHLITGLPFMSEPAKKKVVSSQTIHT